MKIFYLAIFTLLLNAVDYSSSQAQERELLEEVVNDLCAPGDAECAATVLLALIDFQTNAHDVGESKRPPVVAMD